MPLWTIFTKWPAPAGPTCAYPSSGAGHFVKMVHNGIEYGVMAAYAEGLNILKNADAGKHEREADAETAPLEHPARRAADTTRRILASIAVLPQIHRWQGLRSNARPC